MKLELRDLNIPELIEEIKDSIQNVFSKIVEKVEMYNINGNIIENIEFESIHQPIAIDIYVYVDRIYDFGEVIRFNHISCGYIDYDFTCQVIDGKGAQSLELELDNIITNEINSYFEGYTY